jgi:hypothetical protein
MIPEILSPTDDWIFKLLFGDERNKSMLIDLLGSFVELPKEEFELTYLDTHLKPESEDKNRQSHRYRDTGKPCQEHRQTAIVL